MKALNHFDPSKIINGLQLSQDYLLEKIRIYEEILEEKTGSSVPEFSEQQKKRLAQAGKKLDWMTLSAVENTWSPDTILSWHRQLVGQKYDSSKVRPENKRGRKTVSQEIIETVLRFANRNRDWGYMRIADCMRYLGFDVSVTTVRNILDDYGIVPDPEKRPSGNWHLFFEVHKNVLLSTDFAAMELLTPEGLQRAYMWFFEDVTTREVWLAGICAEPNEEWVCQITDDLCADKNSFLHGSRYLIHDRGTVFTEQFQKKLNHIGLRCKKLPPRRPELNAHVESFIKTLRTEYLNKLVLTSEKQLKYVVDEFLLYYNHERPHSGLGGRLIHPWPQDLDGEIAEFSRLGGLLKSYHRVKKAA